MKKTLLLLFKTTTNKDIANLLCENHQGFYTIDDMLYDIETTLFTTNPLSLYNAFKSLSQKNYFGALQKNSTELAIKAIQKKSSANTVELIGRYLLTRPLSMDEKTRAIGKGRDSQVLQRTKLVRDLHLHANHKNQNHTHDT